LYPTSSQVSSSLTHWRAGFPFLTLILNPTKMTKEESNLLIIKLLAEGKVQKEIAEELGLTYDTVVDRIYKMKKEKKCATQTQLVVTVIRENILSFRGLP
jgi:DNA-binding NarL/FixJ family response regulator